MRNIKQYLTTDASIFLNHCLLFMILDKVGFNSKISQFFSDYLINRLNQYIWNNFTSPFFRANVGIGQKSTLLPILSALYITPIFYLLEKRTKNFSIPILISFLLFVNNSLCISQEKSFEKSNANLFCSYSILFFFSDSLVLLLSMISQKFFIFLDCLETLILLLYIWGL